MPKEKETSSDQLSNDKSNAPKGDILVLLVGIDNYAQIRGLSGCINDLNRMESFLKKRLYCKWEKRRRFNHLYYFRRRICQLENLSSRK